MLSLRRRKSFVIDCKLLSRHYVFVHISLRLSFCDFFSGDLFVIINIYLQIVEKSFAKRQNLQRQLRIVHEIDTVNLQEKNSSPCKIKCSFLIIMKKDIQDMHNTEQADFWPYCINIYLSL